MSAARRPKSKRPRRAPPAYVLLINEAIYHLERAAGVLGAASTVCPDSLADGLHRDEGYLRAFARHLAERRVPAACDTNGGTR